MKNLTIITRIVIQNDFGFGNAGSIVPVGFGDEIIVLICARRSIVIVINACRKRCDGQRCKNANYHHTSHQKRDTALECLFHIQTPFLFIFISSEKDKNIS